MIKTNQIDKVALYDKVLAQIKQEKLNPSEKFKTSIIILKCQTN